MAAMELKTLSKRAKTTDILDDREAPKLPQPLKEVREADADEFYSSVWVG